MYKCSNSCLWCSCWWNLDFSFKSYGKESLYKYCMNVDDGRIMCSWRSCLLYLLYMLYQLITFCHTYMYMYLLYTYVYLIMYCSLPGSPYCPVMSFQNYVRRLHPSNERLWQKPLDSFSENSPVWYCNSGVGEKPSVASCRH